MLLLLLMTNLTKHLFLFLIVGDTDIQQLLTAFSHDGS